ncbi:carbonic anhydrase [Planctopirus limnophila DSM 3776]|uniref:carbonic anhydrase n=1 Tax=Planctopirus limnophila (strain ATCC 43296 / DSM 3776 / IFAM 1008 / Mu 290) TaxID=521674 RepID=D5SWB5_PLAL2|nr:carbonic anhydrase [Planctopirus limnophila]ADG69508.1 carbonic anhydrase [Planctopirus limnophila DSM 3776]
MSEKFSRHAANEAAMTSPRTSSRRMWLKQMTATACGCGMVGSGLMNANTLLGEEPMQVPMPTTPQEALDLLYHGNERFSRGQSMAAHRDLDRVKAVARKQSPFAAFLGCADSRVPIEIVFDQGFGDLFVTRIAGNIASSENIGSLEFGAQILGSKVIYVLGHSACGAVTATMEGREVPGQISGLFQYIRPAVKAAKGDVEVAVRENVKNQAMLIAESSPVISRLVQKKELIVAGGVYDLQSGVVTPVEMSF